MKKYSKSDILEMAKKENVTYIRLQFSDILGNIKAVEINVSSLSDALDNKIIFDGSSVEGFVRIKEADMSLHPDYDTWTILSFEDPSYGKVARLICDVYTSYGKPFQGDPRYILKKQIRALNDAGIMNFDVGFEPEFFLFKLDEKGQPIVEPIDDGSYFDLSPIDGAQNIRRDIAMELEKLGFVISTAHHEVAPGQEEINFRFAHVLEACDNLQTFKQVVKCIARKHGYHATFMPKPIVGINGSGMHTNCSMSDAEGTNLFYDANDPMKLSLMCRKFISGILRHARGMAAITNPTVNSYKRLIPGYEAPCYVCWSDANRSSMIRIPASRGQGTRAELRHVDAMANPYLALAVIIGAGLDGINNTKEEELIPPVYDNIFSLTREQREAQGIMNLPENLKDAVKEAKSDPLVYQVLGEHCFNKFITAKNLEWEQYRCLISDWEYKMYLSK
ncbi:MAG: type I glutamate--ammonia ligase [Bacilli bacterium]|nr:type I glutamate--ammonia ligase [Bacilli bacterium]MBO6286861.1 type I glutamate--ammonia ligase [Bacilli bacterium]MBR3675220.1 type I glutamate--ammonia ligase [Bacilli bacterium]